MISSMSRMPEVLCIRCASVMRWPRSGSEGRWLRTSSSIDSLPSCGQQQDRGAGELLADRGDAECRLRADRHAELDARHAGALVHDEVAAEHNANGHARAVDAAPGGQAAARRDDAAEAGRDCSSDAPFKERSLQRRRDTTRNLRLCPVSLWRITCLTPRSPRDRPRRRRPRPASATPATAPR